MIKEIGMSDPVMREDWAALIDVLDLALKGIQDRRAGSVRRSLLEFSSTAAMLGMEDLAAAGTRFQEFFRTEMGDPWQEHAAAALGASMAGLRDSMEANGFEAPFSADVKGLLSPLDSFREKAECPPPAPPQTMDTVDRYRELLQLDPSSQIFVTLAEALCSQKAWAEAISVCRRGLTFHPQNLAGRVLLGWSLWESGELEEGESILQDARKDFEKNAVLYKILAAAAERNGDAENSSGMMKRYHAIASEPDRPPSALPAPQPEAAVAAAPLPVAPSGEVETIPLRVPEEPAEAPLQEAALEMPGEDVDTSSSAPSVAAFCKFLEQYTRKPPLTFPGSVFFSREDRDALKKILQCRTAKLS